MKIDENTKYNLERLLEYFFFERLLKPQTHSKKIHARLQNFIAINVQCDREKLRRRSDKNCQNQVSVIGKQVSTAVIR